MSIAVDALLPQHLADLRKSGLSDEQIAKCGFQSLQTPEAIGDVLGWRRYDGSLGPCLVIPFRDAKGQPTKYRRLKPDKPRAHKDGGKLVKYEAPRGSTSRAYFPPGVIEAIQGPITQPLYLTEGEKKAAKADQEGLRCIGLVGVWNWQKRQEENEYGEKIGVKQLIDDLAAIDWTGVIVLITFDSDRARNSSIRKAEWELGQVLKRHGASVKIVRLPEDEDAHGNPVKVGLDDYLVAHGVDDFRKLVDAATEAAEPKATELGPNETVDNPTRLAREFLEGRCSHDDGPLLRRHNDQWYWWTGVAYRLMPDAELEALQHGFVQRRFEDANLFELEEWEKEKLDNPRLKKPTVRKISAPLLASIDLALAAKTIVPATRPQPCWLDDVDEPDPRRLLVCRNGMIDLPALVNNKPHFYPSTPAFFATGGLDYDFDPLAPAPAAWLKFLNQVWPDDSESVGTLQEWMGYLLTPTTEQQKIALLVGPKRSGKGTIGRVIRALVGEENVAGPTLAGLGTNFGLWPLVGKSVAIISDARLSGRTDVAIVAERLLSISGEDAVTVDRKNMSLITTRLTSRFMIFSNELPRLTDASGALASRFLLLRMVKSFYGQEDHGLSDRLIAERRGILLWAIEGWKRLRGRGHFVQPTSSREMLNDIEDLSSPVGAFVKECCTVGPGFMVSVNDIFARWKRWCDDMGRKEPGTAAVFGRDLSASVPSIRKTRPRDGDERFRAYEGIGLRP